MIFQLFGYNFSGCGSKELETLQTRSSMSSLPSYTDWDQQTQVFETRSYQEKRTGKHTAPQCDKKCANFAQCLQNS